MNKNKAIAIISTIIIVIIIMILITINNNKNNIIEEKQENTIIDTIKVQEIHDVYKTYSIGKCINDRLEELCMKGITNRFIFFTIRQRQNIEKFKL